MPLNPFISVPDTDLDAGLQAWLHEDIGRGDWTTLGLGALVQRPGQAIWVARGWILVCRLMMQAAKELGADAIKKG